MRVLLLDRFGKPLLVWQEDVSYQRNLAGFENPAARERANVLLRSGASGPQVDPEIPEAEGSRGEGPEAEASED